MYTGALRESVAFTCCILESASVLGIEDEVIIGSANVSNDGADVAVMLKERSGEEKTDRVVTPARSSSSSSSSSDMSMSMSESGDWDEIRKEDDDLPCTS